MFNDSMSGMIPVIGAAAGSILVLLALAFVIFLIFRKKSKENRPTGSEGSSVPSDKEAASAAFGLASEAEANNNERTAGKERDESAK